MEKHFVTFYSPGTMFAETSSKEIDSWDVDKAIEISKEIKERHSAVPYGFKFTTRGREDDELDSKQIAKSGMYHLGGTIHTLKEIKARNMPNDQALISNMESNKWDKVIENNNSWKSVQPFRQEDTLLELVDKE